jgi:WhiB family redox-sensing transcriptional regulator
LVRPWWHREAACKGLPADWFFPLRGERWTPAMEVCAGCSVQPWCLLASLARGEKHGIWGGTSDRTRRRYRWTRLAAVVDAHPFVVATLRTRTPPEGWQDQPRVLLPKLESRKRTPEERARINVQRSGTRPSRSRVNPPTVAGLATLSAVTTFPAVDVVVLLTPHEVANRLGVRLDHVWWLVREGALVPHRTTPRPMVLAQVDVDAYDKARARRDRDAEVVELHALGLSERAIAAKLGVDRSVVSRALRAKPAPPLRQPHRPGTTHPIIRYG